jgi:putative protease
METGNIEVSDNILIVGPTSGVVELKVENIIKEDISIQTAEKGDRITFPCPQLVRPHDTVYKVVNLSNC